jgi:hypothetical protein
MFCTINSFANLLSVYWIPNRRLKGILRDYLRMRRNCFDPVADIAEQPKDSVSDRKDYQLQYDVRNKQYF